MEAHMQRIVQWLCGWALATVLVSAPAAAEQYPARNVEIVVSYGAGGSTDFIAHIRANPGKYTYGGSVDTPPHIMGAWMNKIRGLNVTHVPYRGGAQGVNDVVGGHLDMFYGGVAVGKSAIASGYVRPLAVT